MPKPKALPLRPKKPAKGLVLAFGTFDLLHPGHLFYLGEAKKLGKKLVVIVARDSNVLHFKGHLPVNQEAVRLVLVESLKPVSKAVFGQRSDFFSIIKRFNPEFIALGHDQWPGQKKLQTYLDQFAIPAKIRRLPAYKSRVFKSHHIKNRIKNGH